MSSYTLHHPSLLFFFFFFNDTPTTEIYTLSLHDALPISCPACGTVNPEQARFCMQCATPLHAAAPQPSATVEDRKSTRLNSSHVAISYAVFCLKKKKKKKKNHI